MSDLDPRETVDAPSHQRVLERLRQCEERYIQLAEQLPAITFIVDLLPTPRTVYISPQVQTILGFTPREWIADRSLWIRQLLPEDRDRIVEDVLRHNRTAEPYFLEYRTHRKDGSVVWLRNSATYQTDPATGTPVAVHGVMLDITDRKQLEDQLHQAQKLESMGRLAGGIAHDFNNMLQTVLGNTEMALEEAPPGHPLRESLEEIQGVVRKSTDLTRQLLAFARKQPIAPKVLDLNETVAGMLKMLRRLLGEGVRLDWRPGDSLWPIEADSSQIDQVLVNLCVNARDAVERGGLVTVASECASYDDAFCARHSDHLPGDYVILTVEDNGKGMTPEVLDRLFEPFFTTKTDHGGCGLGLATVYGIVRQNQGFVTVRSALGQGATFRIHWPRYRGPVDRTLAREAKPMPSNNGETLLVVEDDPTILYMAKRMLQRSGYRVLDAGSPEQAIELAKHHDGPVHLVLADVVMPGMDGPELAKAVETLHPGVRSLFMSGHTADTVVRHGVPDGALHFLQKPFSACDLAQAVGKVLGRSSSTL